MDSKDAALAGEPLLQITPDRWVNHSISEIFKTGAFSDCKIVLQNKTFSGHILILAGSCKYFEKVFCGDFKESSEKKLDLSEENQAHIMAMIKFICGFPYSALLEPEDSDTEAHVHLYAIADKYEYQPLKAAAEEHLRKISTTTKLEYGTLLSLLSLMETYTAPGDGILREIAKAFTKTNIELVKALSPEQHEAISRRLPRYCADVVNSLDTNPEFPYIYHCSYCDRRMGTTAPAKNCATCSDGDDLSQQ